MLYLKGGVEEEEAEREKGEEERETETEKERYILLQWLQWL